MKNKIIYENDSETNECNKGIANLQIDNETFKQVLIGDWDIEELGEAKKFLNELIDEKIKNKLSQKNKRIYQNLKEKEKEKERKFYNNLSDSKKRIYKFINPEFQMFNLNLLSDKEAKDLLNQLDDLVDNQTNNKGEINKEKVVNLKDFK